MHFAVLAEQYAAEAKRHGAMAQAFIASPRDPFEKNRTGTVVSLTQAKGTTEQSEETG